MSFINDNSFHNGGGAVNREVSEFRIIVPLNQS